MSTTTKDRTSEFRSALELSLRNHIPSSSSSSSKPLLAPHQRIPPGEFSIAANAIRKQLGMTAVKLDKLGQLARRKTLFDDRPVEISELTYIIKQDIATLNTSIAKLQSLSNSIKSSSSSSGSGGSGISYYGSVSGVKVRAGGSGAMKIVEEHMNNVVVMLQKKLADTSIGFKDLLEIRTQNMKASRDRTEQFMYGSSSQLAGPSSVLRSRSATKPFNPSDSPLYSTARPSHLLNVDGSVPSRSMNSTPLNLQQGGHHPQGQGQGQDGFGFDESGKGKGVVRGGGAGGGYDIPRTSADDSRDFLALDMGTPNNANSFRTDQMQQMQLLDPSQQQSQDDQYYQSRTTAISQIEGTIQELGQIFGQLAQMVAMQGETVQRIDEDVRGVETNVEGAQRELLRYYANISSNRWLLLKVFGVIIVFFLLFVLLS